LPEAPDTEPILLTPGPVSLTPDIVAAMSRPLPFHRGGEFHALHRGLVDGLARLFEAPATHQVLVLSGSGTMANEAMLSSTLGPQDHALVLVNGQFAERLVEILRCHGVPHRTLAVPFGQAFDLDAVERAVAAPDVTAVVMVAMETGLGLLNPVRDVGRLCRAARRLFFVDAVSALGAERLSVGADGIDFCSSVGNKGLGGPPGASFVCADRDALRSRRPAAPRSWYLDLHRYADWARVSETPTTPPIPVLLGLEAALRATLAEGVERRRARFRGLTAIAIEAAARLGAAPLVSPSREASRAAAVTTLIPPPSLDAGDVVRHARAHGFILHEVRVGDRSAFQVAVMGAVREEHLRRLAQRLDDLAPHAPPTAGTPPPSSASAAGTPRSRS